MSFAGNFGTAQRRQDGEVCIPFWLKAVGFALAYFACAELSRFLSVKSSPFETFWLPAGLYVGALLLNEPRTWPGLVLAALLANFAFDLLHGTKFLLIFFFCGAGTIEALLAAWLVRRFIDRRPTLATLREFAGLLTFAAGLGALLSAIVGTIGLTVFGESRSFKETCLDWWADNAMSVLLVTPLMLAWLSNPDPQRRWRHRSGKLAEAVLLFAGLCALTWYVFIWGNGILSPRKTWLIPFLLWAGVRFGPRGATISSLWLALLSAFLTTHYQRGLTPADITSGEYVLVLQTFLAMLAMVGVIPAIVLNERDRTLASLHESEERFRHLTQAAFEGVCISENGRILDMNDQGLKMFGYEREEMIGKEIVDLVAPGSRDIVALAVREGRESDYEHRLLRRDGSCFDAEARAKMLRVGRRTLRMTALRDITERKKAGQALRESEEKFSKAFRASPDGLAISELETGRYIEVNEGYCRLYGYQREEMLGHTSPELGIWENSQDRARLVDGLKTAGVVRNLEVRTRTRNGELRVILLSAESIDLAGKPCLVSVLHDVTDRIQAEQALRESEEKYSKAFRNSPDAVIITHLPEGRIIETNEAFGRIFGCPPEAAVGRTTIELRIWGNPADRDVALRELHQTGYVRNWELPFRTLEGKLGVGLLSAEKIEIQGEPCMVAVLRDITEWTKAEAALRASEESLRATIEHTPHVAVQWFDAQGHVLFWNRASEQMYGWTAAEASGKDLAQLIFAPAEAVAFKQALKEIEQTGEAIGPVEFPFRRRDGSPGIVLSTVFRIPGPTGEMRFVCMDVDLTDRKAAETERADAVLREQQARAEYTLQLIASQEAERARIAAELHDSLGQNLLLIKNRAQLALAGKKVPAGLREQFETISELASQSIAEARHISHDLHPYQLDHLGLTRALGAMIDTAAGSSGMVLEPKLDNVDDLFSKDAALNLYRVVQECLNNILKHSGAKQVHLRLERDLHEVLLHIEDDGAGFNTGEPINGVKGLGLRNIAERVRILGGKIQVDSQPGKGTCIRVAIPVGEGQ